MDFTFTDDQQMLIEGVATLLRKEVTAEQIRASWNLDGSDPQLWRQLVELGIPAILVPEAQGGLGLNELDFIRIAEECGRVALAEPIVEMAMVATPMLVQLAEHSEQCAELLEEIAGGDARVAVGHPINPTVADAQIADWLLLPHGHEVHLVPSDSVALTVQESLDPSRRLFTVDWDGSSSTYCVAEEQLGAELWADALNRGALLNAALLIGLTQGMIEQSVIYTTDREQFGRPIGANQAVKHHMANCAVKTEFTKPVIYRAGYEISRRSQRSAVAVSHAKVAAGESALLTAKNSIQVHGAMGYTWECNLQIWAKRAWALNTSWGDAGFHKNRIHDWLMDEHVPLGAENTFSQQVAVG